MTSVHITLKSANAKTGPIPVSTSSREFCPDTCGFKKNGCYAESGPLALHWAAVTRGDRGMSWDSFCETIRAMPDGQLWRHNQAGDLPGDGVNINIDMMAALVAANNGRRGFTYTHYLPSAHNRAIVKIANDCGFTVNWSAESLAHADQLADYNAGPVVVAVAEHAPRTQTTPAGRTVVTCPATYRDDTSCATCQLCQRQRETIVAFPVHGTGKKKAGRVIMLKAVAA